MKSRLIVAAIFVPILIIVMLFLPSIVFTIVLALICAIAAYEFVHATGADKNMRIPVYAIISAAAIVFLEDSGSYLFTFPALMFLLMAVMFVEGIRSYKQTREVQLRDILCVVFAGAVIPHFLSSLITLKAAGNTYLLIPFIIAFITDAGAYFVGVSFGKHKAFPIVSPKKSVEGYIGGLLTGIADMLIYAVILKLVMKLDVNFGGFIILAVVGGIMTEIGDLAFSLIKREYDIKDYGNLLPGHGGMLDRFDSMVFCAPAVLYLMSLSPKLFMFTLGIFGA